MFKNIGKKIKTLAEICCYITISISVLLAFVGAMSLFAAEQFVGGFFVLIFGILIGIFVAWLSTVILYGFGELIDQTQQSTEYLKQLTVMQRMQITDTIHTSPQMPPQTPPPAAGFYPGANQNPYQPPVQNQNPPFYPPRQ